MNSFLLNKIENLYEFNTVNVLEIKQILVHRKLAFIVILHRI